MALPTLTPEQRAEALAKAQAARKKRSELLASVKAGKTSIAQVLAKTDDITKKTKVSQVIRAMPGYGPAKAAAVMEEKPDHVPIARPRSSRENETLIRARLPGTRSAPPTPWSARAKISRPVPDESPHHAEAAENSATPTANTLRLL